MFHIRIDFNKPSNPPSGWKNIGDEVDKFNF